MKHAYVATISVILLSGCATAGELLQPEIDRVNTPPTGQQTTVRLGEPLLKKAKLYTYDAIDLQEEFKVGDGAFTQKITFPPQKLKAKRELKNNILYMAEEATSGDMLLGTRPVLAGLCIPKDDPLGKWRVYLSGQCTVLGKQTLPAHEFTKSYDTNRPSLTRELIYNGRVGDNVKMIYRELSNDAMRPAFQQDLQYDLSQSTEIGFREVTLRVVDADNQTISYIVDQHFNDLE